MDDTITTIYCLCDDFLKAMRRFDEPQVRLTTAEVMSVPLVASTFFAATSTRPAGSSKSTVTCQR